MEVTKINLYAKLWLGFIAVIGMYLTEREEGESYVAEIGNTLSSSTIVVDETFITRY